MAEEITAAPGVEQPRRSRASGGRWLAVLALLVALAAACGFAYLYYTLVIHDPAADDARRLAELQVAQSRLRDDLQRLTAERQAAFEAFRADLEERQRASEKALAESAGGLTVPDYSPNQEWKLAEAEFLLRAANYKALFEQDVDAALRLLRSADGILGGLGGPAALRARSTIASELLSLEQADAVDPSAIYLRLDAIKRRLTDLRLALPEYTAAVSAYTAVPETAAAPLAMDNAGNPVPFDSAGSPVPDPAFTGQTSPEPAAPPMVTGGQTPDQDADSATEAFAAGDQDGFFAALGRELGQLVRFRRIDTTLERPPAPAESDLLEINLRLMLEQAQLAALKRDQAVYAASLDAALDWARALLDRQDGRVRETIEALEALRHLDLEKPLPDISGSLDELLEARPERS